jgi:hypothetical protein
VPKKRRFPCKAALSGMPDLTTSLRLKGAIPGTMALGRGSGGRAAALAFGGAH